jgi:hypothetical protein
MLSYTKQTRKVILNLDNIPALSCHIFFFFTTLLKCRSGAVLREVHRKTLLEALAEELPIDTIRFSFKLTSIRTQGQEGSSIALIDMEDGTTIRAKGTCH